MGQRQLYTPFHPSPFFLYRQVVLVLGRRALENEESCLLGTVSAGLMLTCAQ